MADSPGDALTIEALVTAYYEPIYRYAYRLSGSMAEAQDLTQEAFCKAQVGLRQLRDRDRAKAWLFSILRNEYLHSSRANRKRQHVSLDDVGDVLDELPDPLPNVDPEQVQQALDALPEEFRTPVILFYFDDFTYREIAEHMNLPLGTVMSRLARAKNYLRSRLIGAVAVARPAGGVA